MGGIYLLLLAQGVTSIIYGKAFLEKSVLITALGTTTLNVIGLFYVVTKYFFPGEGTVPGKQRPSNRRRN